MVQRAREEGMPQDRVALIGMYMWAAGAAGRHEEVAEWSRRMLEIRQDESLPGVSAELALLNNDEHAWQEALLEISQRGDMEVWGLAGALTVDFQPRLGSRRLRALQQVWAILTEPGGRSSEIKTGSQAEERFPWPERRGGGGLLGRNDRIVQCTDTQPGKARLGAEVPN